MSQTTVESAREFVLRIAASGKSDRTGEEYRVSEGEATIGRSPECTVVLADGSVSRRHAKIERVDGGFKVTDLGSANGIWIGSDRLNEGVVAPRQQFRIGSTVFECVAEDGDAMEAMGDTRVVAVDEAVEAPEVEEGFVLTVLSLEADATEGREVPVSGDSAVIGRGQDCTVTLDAADVSRQHARIERATGDRFRVIDLGSTNGTWIGDQRLTEPADLGPGDPVRLGSSTVLECRPAGTPAAAEAPGPAAAGETMAGVAPDHTVSMPTSAALVDTTRRVEDAGELHALDATEPFLLEDPEVVWYVVSGSVDIFTVTVEEGEATGTRSHFLEVLEGQCFFSFDPQSHGMGSGFLAVPKKGTEARKIPFARLQDLAATTDNAEAIAALVDNWVAGLARSLTRDVPQPEGEVATLEASGSLELHSEQRCRAGEEVLWVDICSGDVLYLDMATPVFTERRGLFPLTSETWIQPSSDEFGDLALEPRTTGDAVGEPELWEGLVTFHEVLCECEFINKKLHAVDEFVRLQDKARYAEAAKEAAYDAIGSVLRTEADRPREFLSSGRVEPVLHACELVAEEMGIEVENHPEADEQPTYQEKVQAIANASGFQTRVVALRDEWWTEDHGPLLGQLEEESSPVALLPTSPRSYECVDPESGVRREVDESVADEIAEFGYTFYRPFPEGPVSAVELMRFGARGLDDEFKLLILMGILIGLLGAVTPYVTGWIFDRAIPQSDRGMLFTFAGALFVTAVATSLFKVTQGIATVRVQGKMEGKIQSALWDRLLNLPANFFRRFSAGDLAERVAGIDAIQSLVSGAGIAAILGSFSGLFYVAVMFMYNFRLAATGIGLTALFVGCTMAGNYLQLRHQRIEVRRQGRITGLVLNLITGVTKLRNAGAEHHAFREWAEKFSDQKKTAFSIGTIQNYLTVFSEFFPVLSSMVIFWVMVQAQAEAAQTGETVLTTGEFIAFNSAFGLFLAAMQSLGDASMKLLRAVPIYERLRPILVTSAEVDEAKAYPGKLQGAIRLSNVFFKYEEDGPWIIEDLSLEIEPGEFVAFVGGSGCGKSTLMRLMLGFEKPASGSILYDGQDLSNVDVQMLRQQLGVVLQKSQVLPTDIYRNIVGTSSKSVEDAWEAAEMAGLAEDIRLMPMKMHTYVSEGGGTLSGGQRQRLLIARALVDRPNVMFLDEATSALDNRAQARVTESMDRLDATRIVIAHRLSTVVNADKICYLKDGGIAELGTYEELMEEDGHFAELARRQMA